MHGASYESCQLSSLCVVPNVSVLYKIHFMPILKTRMAAGSDFN